MLSSSYLLRMEQRSEQVIPKQQGIKEGILDDVCHAMDAAIAEFMCA